MLIFSCSFGQISQIDSLIQKLSSFSELPLSFTNDTSKVNVLIAISNAYAQSEKDSLAEKYSNDALKISERINFKRGVAGAYTILAGIQDKKGDYKGEINYFSKILVISQEINDKSGIARSYQNIASSYYNLGIFDKASEHFYKALLVWESMTNKKGIASTYNQLGLLFRRQNKYDESLMYHLKALALQKELGDKKGIAGSYGNMGIDFEKKGMLDTALAYNLFAMKLNEETGYKKGMASTLDNLGTIYSKQGKYKEALENLFRALKIARSISYVKAVSACYKNIGEVYTKQKSFKQAEAMLDTALALYRKMGQKSGLKDTYKSFAELYYAKGDFRNAYEYTNRYGSIKDTLLNEKNTRQVAELQTIYETEKKNKQIEIQDLQLSQQKLELNKKQIVIYSISAGLFLILLLAFFIYRGYTNKQNANKILSEKNELIEKQNGKIIDSLNYAKAIQKSIFVDAHQMKKIFSNSFLFLRPRDIVSGDFHWLFRLEDKAVVATVDCTGHGVPGAFMSMIGNMLLNDIIIDKKIYIPSEVLKAMHAKIYHLLHQERGISHAQDGMDMSLCVIDFQEQTLQFAGARNSLVLIENGVMDIIHADSQSIGGKGKKDAIFSEREFTNHSIPFSPGTHLYLFSDGFADQFGGEDKKKFGSQQFKELLLKNSHLSMDEQRRELEKEFEKWKGKDPQLDDVLVMGIQV